ncbi:hypothetical protein [Micromonospora sp. NPDC001898]|uniref:hypothetical protein n=1 Tax=Micromonospora sp. NPDC001898 TaxID=3364221 RepID=UPI00368A530C
MTTTTTTTPLDLDAIRLREQAATSGPWTLRDGFGPLINGTTRFGRIANAEHQTVIEEPYSGRDLGATQADAEFIAAARQDIPDLLAEVDRLHTENLRMTEAAASDVRRVRELVTDMAGETNGLACQVASLTAELEQVRKVAMLYRASMVGQHDWAGHLIEGNCGPCQRAMDEVDGSLACEAYQQWQAEYVAAIGTHLPQPAAEAVAR